MKRYLVRRTFDAVPADAHGLDGVVELVDMSGGASNVTVGQSVADLTALAAVTKGDTRPDRQTRFVEAEGASYAYDEQASSGDVQPDDSNGTGTGFGNGWWSKFAAAGGGAETLIKTTDDIKAILEAASDGSAFVLESGVHAVTAAITIESKKNISISGTKSAIVERSDDNEWVFYIKGCEDFTMEGFTIRSGNLTGWGSGSLQLANASSGSYLNCVRHRYANLHFEQSGSGQGYGFYNGATFQDSIVEGCMFNGRFATCINTGNATQETHRTQFVGNVCTTTYTGTDPAIKVDSANGYGLLVEHNVISGPFGVGIDYGASDYVEGSSICDNYIEFVVGDGIVMTNSNSWHALVCDNIIVEPGARGISLNGQYVCCCGNTIYYPTTDGIYVTGSNHDISDNVSQGGGGDGIEMVSATTCSVDGNLVFDYTGYGISLDASSDDNVLDSNQLTDNGAGKINNLGTDNEINGKVENTVQTTADTTPTISTIAIPDDTSVLIEVSVVAFSTNGADQAAYKKAALVYRRSAGSATLQGAVQDVMADIESDAGFDATIAVSGNNAIVTVTGVVAKTMEWKSRHTVQEVS